jgi:hypothetical protein
MFDVYTIFSPLPPPSSSNFDTNVAFSSNSLLMLKCQWNWGVKNTFYQRENDNVNDDVNEKCEGDGK